jgi:uncharacterized membrane protein
MYMSLTISGVISRSWKAFTQNIGTWLLVDLILILTQIPGNIGRNSASSQLTNYSDPDSLLKAAEANPEPFSPVNFFVQIIMALIAIYVSMATVRFAAAHLKDKKISFSEAFEFKQYWSVLGATILVGLIVVPISLLIGGTLIGFLASTFAFSNGNPQFNAGSAIFILAFIASFILLIWVAIRLSFVQQYVQLSDKGVIDSIVASWKATKGNVWFLVGFGFVMLGLTIAALIPLLLGLLVMVPLSTIAMVDIYNQISKKNAEDSPQIMV